MRLVICTKSFEGMDGDKSRVFHEGDELPHTAAQWAIDNGHGEELEDRPAPRPAPPAARQPQRQERRENRRRNEGSEGEGQ